MVVKSAWLPAGAERRGATDRVNVARLPELLGKAERDQHTSPWPRRGSLRTIKGALADCRHANRSPSGPPRPEHRRKARSARANRTAADLAPVIAELRSAGITSKKGIAKALIRRAVRTREASASGGRYRSREYWRGCRPDLALRSRHGTRDDIQGRLGKPGTHAHERSSYPLDPTYAPLDHLILFMQLALLF
jgi:hypothetical protein